MNGPDDTAVFDYLLGKAADSPAAARLRDHLEGGAADPEAGAALARFRKTHIDLLTLSRSPAAAEGFLAKLDRITRRVPKPGGELPLAAEIPDPPAKPAAARRATWRDYYDQLRGHVRDQFAIGVAAPPSAPTTELALSTVLSSYMRGVEDARARNYRDPTQLWPVLIELTARKLGRPPTAASITDPTFQDGLNGQLERVFGDPNRDDRQRTILALTLLGKAPAAVARRAQALTDDVTDVLRVVHAKLLAELAA